MKRFIEGVDRTQSTLFPALLDEYVAEDNGVRIIEAFIDSLNPNPVDAWSGKHSVKSSWCGSRID